MERRFPFVEGEYYHVYNRGVEKRRIFQEPSDWVRFQHLLYLCNNKDPLVFKEIQGDPLGKERTDTLADIVAYALMPNHYHLFLYEKASGGISKLMSKIQTAFSMFFNTKYQRSGPLFCRPFRAQHVDSNEYFQWLFSYIHTNPIELNNPEWKEKGIADFPSLGEYMRSYKYSSYADYFVGTRPETKILQKENLPIESLVSYDLEQLLAGVSKDSPWEEGIRKYLT